MTILATLAAHVRTDACVHPDAFTAYVPVIDRPMVAGRIVEPSTPPVGLQRAVAAAFRATHDGWSADEVILDDPLNRDFLEACRRAIPTALPTECNWTLLNLRKAGKLTPAATRRRPSAADNRYTHAAEIAARLMVDRYGLTLDRVLCDPAMRAQFDRAALAMVPPKNDVSPYALRKAAMRLRKGRRLRPELVLRIAEWGRTVVTESADRIAEAPEIVPKVPGIYIFRDRTGYLYVGESASLRQRLAQHLDASDRRALADYLEGTGAEAIQVEMHLFDPTSSARHVSHRRAYESELIRSRHPRFNLRP